MKEKTISEPLHIKHKKDFMRVTPVEITPLDEVTSKYKQLALAAAENLIVLTESREKGENAIIDTLTNLRNSKALSYDIPRFLEHAQATGDAYWVLSMDCDGLKLVNDKYGHNMGDEFIKIAAKAMEDSLLPSDTKYRSGGDEFTAILQRPDNPSLDLVGLADVISGRINTSFKEDVKSKFPEIDADSTGVSVGVALWDPVVDDLPPKKSWEVAFEEADARMYKSKRDKKQQK